MIFVIGRPVEGIPLNGNEYVLDAEGYAKTFDSIEDAKSFLRANGITEEDVERQGIVIEEVVLM